VNWSHETLHQHPWGAHDPTPIARDDLRAPNDTGSTNLASTCCRPRTTNIIISLSRTLSKAWRFMEATTSFALILHVRARRIVFVSYRNTQRLLSTAPIDCSQRQVLVGATASALYHISVPAYPHPSMFSSERILALSHFLCLLLHSTPDRNIA
jgi:hypothetical protein